MQSNHFSVPFPWGKRSPRVVKKAWKTVVHWLQGPLIPLALVRMDHVHLTIHGERLGKKPYKSDTDVNAIHGILVIQI